MMAMATVIYGYYFIVSSLLIVVRIVCMGFVFGSGFEFGLFKLFANSN